jgi:putative endonuclease
MKYYVYILQAADGYLYTGTTKNLEKRLERHNRGRGGRFTKGRRPLRLRYYEEYADLKSAMKREMQIKKLSRIKKQELLYNFEAR